VGVDEISTTTFGDSGNGNDCAAMARMSPAPSAVRPTA
jgi:hypothetical protein